jgi:uncharacterized membrane protein
MLAINLAAPPPVFMLALLGTAAVCLVLVVWALVQWGEPGAGHVLAASVLYLVTIVITAAFHIPRNDALAALDPDTEESARRWGGYVRSWTAGNHIRTLTATAAAAIFTLGIAAG